MSEPGAVWGALEGACRWAADARTTDGTIGPIACPSPGNARPGGAASPGMARSRVILESVYVLSERPCPRDARGVRAPPELVGPVAGLEPATC